MGTRKIKRTSESLDESFLPSKKPRKKSGRGSGKASKPGFLSKLKKVNRVHLGYFLFGLAVFFFVLVTKIPFDRFGGRVLVEMSRATNMDIDASDVDISFLFGPRIIFSDLQIRARSGSRMRQGSSSKLEQALISEGITIKEFVFRPSILQIIQSQFKAGAVPGGSFSADAFGGEISGSFSMISKLEAEIYAEDISLTQVRVLQKASNVKGQIEALEFEISAQRARLGNASGELNVQAKALEFNPGVFVNDAFVKSLGILKLGDLNLKGTATNGRLRFNQATLKGKATDIEADLSGELKLSDRVEATAMDLTLRLTPRDKLRTILDNPIFGAVFAKDARGGFATKLEGSFMAPRPKPYKPGS